MSKSLRKCVKSTNRPTQAMRGSVVFNKQIPSKNRAVISIKEEDSFISDIMQGFMGMGG
jgi:hypothetical protein